jgi:hypothetical protein
MRPALVGVGLLAVAIRTAGGQTPRAEAIVGRAIEALGGPDALAKVHSRYARGTVEVLGGYLGPFESWAEAPNRLRTRWDIRVIHHDLGFDGLAGWERQKTVRELAPLDRARAERRALFDPLIHYARLGVPMSVGRAADYLAEGDPPAEAVIFRPRSGLEEVFLFDPVTHLPVREIRKTRYEEGVKDLVIRYGDWRRVGDVMLPHAIDEGLLELPLGIRIEEYRLNESMPDSLFRNPEARSFGRPVEIGLATIPERIYKELDPPGGDQWRRFWGIPFTPTESWLVNLVVREKHGRQVTPTGATIELYAGKTLVKTETLSAAALEPVKKHPVARFHPQDEIFHFRHWFSEPAPLGIDRMRYVLRFVTSGGAKRTAAADIPITVYQSKTRLIAPIKGNFVALTGHEYYEVAHKYEWSQQFSYDFVGLGDDLDLLKGTSASLEDKTTFGRELIAPGDGVVVYTRNDVPDLMPPREYLKLKDPEWAIGGNSVIIDHGNGEYSCLFHMKQGSVRVKIGDRVAQGQVIGQIGSSGSPGTPHVHYQLQAGPDVFGADGLPVRFTNVETVGWQPGHPVETPVRGVFLRAR